MTIRVTVLGDTIDLEVDSANPYDDGHIMPSGEAIRLLEFWQERPTDAFTVRAINIDQDVAFSTALWDSGELSTDVWQPTTEFHDFELHRQDYHGGGDPAWSTASWPFDFEIEVLP